MYTAVLQMPFLRISTLSINDPEYVLVLSGDHIYKMNYDKMLAAHKK